MIRKEDLKETGEVKTATGEIRIQGTMKAGTITGLVMVGKGPREVTSTAVAAKEATSMVVAGDWFSRLCCASTTIAQSSMELMSEFLNPRSAVASIATMPLSNPSMTLLSYQKYSNRILHLFKAAASNTFAFLVVCNAA